MRKVMFDDIGGVAFPLFECLIVTEMLFVGYIEVEN